jgi:hypothetical protein
MTSKFMSNAMTDTDYSGLIKDRIAKGELVVDIFKYLSEQDVSLSKHELANIFQDAFPEVSSEFVHAIWNWKGFGEIGISDEKLNSMAKYYLEIADY